MIKYYQIGNGNTGGLLPLSDGLPTATLIDTMEQTDPKHLASLSGEYFPSPPHRQLLA